MCLGPLISVFFKVLFWVLIYMFLPAQVVLFLIMHVFVYLLLVFVTLLAIFGCWCGSPVIVYVGLSP